MRGDGRLDLTASSKLGLWVILNEGAADTAGETLPGRGVSRLPRAACAPRRPPLKPENVTPVDR